MVEGTITLVIGIIKVNTGVINVMQFFIVVLDKEVMGVNK
jgi:hypothetical protein